MNVKKSIGWSISIVAIFFSFLSQAKTVRTNLFINRGLMSMVKVSPKDNVKLPFIAFNTTDQFSAVNATIDLILGDSLVITLKNNDNVKHGFAIQTTSVSETVIAGQTIVVKTVMREWGAAIYYDPLDYPKNVYLGLAGIIAVQKTEASAKCHWNIKEHSTQFSNDLAANTSVNWATYYPDYFTCNSLSYPDSHMDSTTSIEGNVGDKIYIYMANTGKADHVMHFHGYHCKILQSNKNKNLILSEKDSFPLMPMQTMVLELVLYNKGEYPVHDHNLIAMTGKGRHPYGMMLLIKAK